MDEETLTQPKPAACPHLGLASDPSTHRHDPTTDHRCHAGTVPFAVDEERQSYYCLSDIYDLCPRRVLGAPVEVPEPKHEEAPKGPDQPTPEPSRSGRSRGPLMAGVAALAGVVAVAFAVVWSQGQSPSPAPALVAAPGAVEVPTTSPAPTQPRLEPTTPPTVPAPTIIPTPVPTMGLSLAGGSAPAATPVPPTAVPLTPAPTERPATRTYLVPYGDTLSSISRKYGVPIEDIMRANNIQDRNLILTGRTLIIPEPR